MKKQLIIMSISLVLLLALTACSGQNTKRGETPMESSAVAEVSGEMDVAEKMVENKAPDFMFTDFDGNTVSLADFEGKKVYIKFWASWCSVCKKSLPETDELSAMEKDFEVITVVAPGFSGEKSAEDFKKWYEDLGYENITVVFDEGGKYMNEFGVRAFPSSAHVGEDGSLLKFTVGHSSNEMVSKVFEDAEGM